MGGVEAARFYPDSMIGRPIPLYAHVPFCESLCPFCPFHRVLLDKPLADDYYAMLEGQLQVLADKGYLFSELCVGGGTPTTRPDALVRFIRKAKTLWNINQITVETNPNHLSRDLLEPLRDAGVSRLSVGVQSLHDDRLRMLGRLESYGARERILRSIGQTQGMFDTFNVDMIFNLPGQTMAELDEDLDLLKSTGVDQISYHPLMPTDDDLRGKSGFGKVDFKHEPVMYRRIVERLTPEYRLGSAWCFNRKPQGIDEYFVDSPCYLGIGSGAFSLLDGCFHATSFAIHHYMDVCRSGGDVFEKRDRLGPVAMYAYRLLTCLFGIRVPVDRMRDQPLAALGLRMFGIAHKQDGYYELSSRGRYLWLVMMRRFFMTVNRYRQQMRRGDDVPCPFTVFRVLLRLWSG